MVDNIGDNVGDNMGDILGDNIGCLKITFFMGGSQELCPTKCHCAPLCHCTPLCHCILQDSQGCHRKYSL